MAQLEAELGDVLEAEGERNRVPKDVGDDEDEREAEEEKETRAQTAVLHDGGGWIET